MAKLRMVGRGLFSGKTGDFCRPFSQTTGQGLALFRFTFCMQKVPKVVTFGQIVPISWFGATAEGAGLPQPFQPSQPDQLMGMPGGQIRPMGRIRGS